MRSDAERTRRRRTLILLAVVALAAVVAASAAALVDPSEGPVVVARQGPAPCPRQFGSYHVGHWPPACWRPYGPESPFNRTIPARPRLAPESTAIVRRMASRGWHFTDSGARGRFEFQAANPDSPYDGSTPIYWSQPSDPSATIHCTKLWGRCPLEGIRVKIPARARAAASSDGHMAVVDQRSGWEYDFWQPQRPRHGTLMTSWGGRTRIGPGQGDGLDGDATASDVALLAGTIRAPELAAGSIEHALAVSVPCTSGAVVWPARADDLPCARLGRSNVDAPPMGAHLQLDMTAEQIAATGAPAWQRAIMRTMVRYGMFVVDTNGSDDIELAAEGDRTYTSFGFPPRMIATVKRRGAIYYAPHGVWNLDGVPLDVGRLRVIDPCVGRGIC